MEGAAPARQVCMKALGGETLISRTARFRAPAGIGTWRCSAGCPGVKGPVPQPVL